MLQLNVLPPLLPTHKEAHLLRVPLKHLHLFLMISFPLQGLLQLLFMCIICPLLQLLPPPLLLMLTKQIAWPLRLAAAAAAFARAPLLLPAAVAS